MYCYAQFAYTSTDSLYIILIVYNIGIKLFAKFSILRIDIDIWPNTRYNGIEYQIHWWGMSGGGLVGGGLASQRPKMQKIEVMSMGRTMPQWIKDTKYHFCAACEREDDLQYHHLVPVVLGGKDEPSNIIVLCATCHQKWHNQNGSDHHNYLVKVGIAEAQKRGVHVGKAPADYEKVMRLIAENSTQFREINPYDIFHPRYTEHEIMEMAGVKEVCYAKCKRMLIDAWNADVWPYEWSKPEHMNNRPLYDRVIKEWREGTITWTCATKQA